MTRTSHQDTEDGTSARRSRADASAKINNERKQPIGTPAMHQRVMTIDPSNVEAILRELEADYRRYANPLCPMRAYVFARRAGIDPPNWCLAYVDANFHRILEHVDEYANGVPIGTEAVCVGKAMGFSAEGRGQGGWFQQATILERDRKIYLMIKEKRASGIKLEALYDEAGKKMSVHRSTARRAYMRFAIADADDES